MPQRHKILAASRLQPHHATIGYGTDGAERRVADAEPNLPQHSMEEIDQIAETEVIEALPVSA